MPTTAPTASISSTRSRLTSSATPSSDRQAEPGLPRVIPRASPCLEPSRCVATAWRFRRCGGRRVAARRPAPVLVAQPAAASRRSPSGLLGQHLLHRTGGDDLALAQQQGVGEAGRDLLDVVGDQHGRRRASRPSPAPTAWRPGPRGRRGRGRRRARRAAAARGRSSAPGRSAPACAPPRTGCRRCGRQVPGADLGEQLRRRAPWSRSSYCSRQRPSTPYDAETTTSCTRSSRGIRSARAALVRPIRGRSSKTSTVPSTSPRMPATPDVGWICAEATCSSVVLPAPLGPSTTQRSSSSTVQSMPSSRVASPRRTVTSASSRTASMPAATPRGAAARRANLRLRTSSR